MQTITTIGLDIAKSVFQVHGVDAEGKVIIRRQLKRRYVVWSKYWSEASISSIENLIALITVPVPHRRPG